MKFAYCVQTEGELPEIFRNLKNIDTDVYHLTFRDNVDGSLYLPKSTWTEGRNALLNVALESKIDYDYYIFCDDDVVFLEGSWRSFEADLEKWRPAIGLPAHPYPTQHEAIHSVYDFDAIVNAFHRDLVRDRVLLPYIAEHDSVTWWLSQYFVIHLAGALYPNRVIKFPRTKIDNALHREYPRISAEQFDAFKSFYLDLWSDRDFAEAAFRVHFETRNDPPHPPAFDASYRLTASDRGRIMSAAFADRSAI